MRLKLALLCLCPLLAISPVRAALSVPATDVKTPVESKGPAQPAFEAFRNGDHARAVELARPLAEGGNADALYLLGFASESGQGLAASQEEAIGFYRKAAAKGQNDAIYRMSFILLASEDESLRAEAKAALEKAAEGDVQVAGRILGEAYLRGRLGKEADPANALAWWQKAADAGDTLSLVLLARLYEGQFGFPERIDHAKALAAYEKAAVAGDAGAMVTYASRLLNGEKAFRDEKKGREWIEKAIQAKDAAAYFVLGDYEENVKKDHKAALAAYERGKDAGHVDCAVRAAGFYLAGKGVEKDVDRAMDLLEGAAKNGSVAAHFQLAVSRLSGETPDLLGGYGHLVAAAVGGSPEAQNELGLFYLSGKLATADPAGAVAWLSRAAQGGYPQAQNNLAALYERGAGVPQNYGTAGQLYSLAADQGHGPATFALARLLAEGLGTKADLPKAWAYATFAAERGQDEGEELAANLFKGFDEGQKTAAKKELEAIRSGKANEEKKD